MGDSGWCPETGEMEIDDRDIHQGEDTSGTEYYRVSFGPEESASLVVAAAVSTLEGHAVSAGAPIEDAVDAGALDQLVDHARRRGDPSDLTVTFRYRDYRVVVTPGKIRLEALT